MPPYLRLGSIPRKRHIAHPHEPGLQGRGDLLRRSRHDSPVSRGPTASSITCGRRRACVRLEPAGTMPLGFRRPAGAAASSPQDADASRAPATRSRAASPLLGNDDVIAGALPARAAAGRAVPQRRRRRGHLRPLAAAGTLHTMFGPLPFRDVRLRRHPALHDLSARIRARLPARPARHRGGRQRLDPGAVPQPRRPVAAGRALQRARPARPARGRARSTARRRRRCSIKDGRRLTRYTLAQPSVRRRRLGRHGLSLHVQRRRLRADHRHGPPAAAGAADVRGARVRRLHVRPADARHDPEAIKVPYAHSNVQADEVLYYVRGRFGSRRGVEEASFTLHPRGIPHGPHPGTIVASRDADPDRRAGRDGRHRSAAPA